MSKHPRIHLVSYATGLYRHRQWFLSKSALANGIVDTSTDWTPRRVGKAGFSDVAPDISLSERGSGFWAWKPFIIARKLASVPDGDIVFYCDAGRKYPYIRLSRPIDPLLAWMDEHNQDILPGVELPWAGDMSVWTKRDAFVLTGMDVPSVHSTVPIQASFSLWRANPATRNFVDEWLSWCARRDLVSDDNGITGTPEFNQFRGHRHDQSLLTLCCINHGIEGLDLGINRPDFNERDPNQILQYMKGSKRTETTSGKHLARASYIVEKMEKWARSMFMFGQFHEKLPK